MEASDYKRIAAKLNVAVVDSSLIKTWLLNEMLPALEDLDDRVNGLEDDFATLEDSSEFGITADTANALVELIEHAESICKVVAELDTTVTAKAKEFLLAAPAIKEIVSNLSILTDEDDTDSDALDE